MKEEWNEQEQAAPQEPRPLEEAPPAEASRTPAESPAPEGQVPEGSAVPAESPAPEGQVPEGAAAPEGPGQPQPGSWNGQAPWGWQPGYGPAAPPAGSGQPQPGPWNGQAPWGWQPGYGPAVPPAGSGQPQPGSWNGQAPWGWQPGYGPAVPPAGSGQPQPGPWNGQAPQGWGAPPYAPPGGGAPPRKKMSLGLKVFLWIASALVAGALLGFSAFVVYTAATGGAASPPQEEAVVEELPPEEQLPQEGSQAQEEAPQLELPDVDVTPNTDGVAIQEKPQGEALDAQEVYGRVVQSTVSLEVTLDGETVESTGTGIIATSDGYIITNAHVVLNSKSVLVTVTTYDGQSYEAVVVGMDRSTDLAVIKTNDHGFTPAEFGDAEELSIGEWVLAIGNPGGSRFAGSMTRGIVSGLDRAVERYSENGMTFIQTDAAVNPGNSGGPLVNMYGQVVGINSSKIITENYEGMGFAIPVSKAKGILDQLMSQGYVKGRVRLGISGSDVSDMDAAFNGTPQGFRIISIDEDGAFAGTQAQEGDIITALDGEAVRDLTEISNLLLRYSPGDRVTVTLFRWDEAGMSQELEVEIVLLEDKGETQK